MGRSSVYWLSRAIPAAGVWWGGLALAQVPPDVADAVRRMQREQSQQLQRERSVEDASERARQVQAPTVALESGARPSDAFSADLPAESACFDIATLLVEVPAQMSPETQRLGASALPMDPFRFAHDYLDRFAGQCIGREGINTIVRRLGAQILGRGYTTTRVAVPAQDLASGTLRLTLIPGVIRQIRFADAATRGTWRTAFPARPGDLLDIRDLEQGLEQMKRVPSQDVEMQIVPAELPGESDVVITVRRQKPWKLVAGFDDSGSPGTGKLQANASVGIDNLLGLNDLFNLGGSHDANTGQGGRGTWGANASYSVPWGNWTFGASASTYQYFQRIAGHNETFESSGDSRSAELKAQYLLQRDQFQKNTLQFRLGRRWSHAFIADTEILNQQRNTTFAELAWLHRRQLGPAQLDLQLAYRFGVPWFGGQTQVRTLEPDAPGLRNRFLYRVAVLDATLAVPLSLPVGDSRRLPLRYVTTVHGQYTGQATFSSEFLSIGNRWTVRGFDGDLTLAAERGAYWRNDLEVPLGGSGYTAYLALDAGTVGGPSAAWLAGRTLAGTAVGLRGSPFRGLYFDAFLGWPLYQPDTFPTRKPTGGFSVSYQY